MARTPTTDAAQRTRIRILNAALELFNERGTALVTTNHIAAHADVSPGNLYYWFSGKEEIVHELNAQLVAAHEALWEFRGEEPALLTPEELLARLSDGAALTGRYAFLTRDLFTLLRTDPVFSAEYRTVRTRRIATFTRLAHHWRSLGTMRALDDAQIADLVEAIWILSETWLPFSELDGSIPDVGHGTRLLRAVLRPHLIVG